MILNVAKDSINWLTCYEKNGRFYIYLHKYCDIKKLVDTRYYKYKLLVHHYGKRIYDFYEIRKNTNKR